MKKLLTILFLALMILPLATAMDWDNWKDYNETTKTYTITNALGMGETIAKIKLNTPQINPVGVGYVEVFEMNFETFDNYIDAIQDIKFYNVKDGMKPIEIDLDYKYQVLKNVTGEQCLIDEKSANKTKTCKNITIESYVWEDYNGKDILKGNLTISGWTTTKQGDKIEWIPTYFGEKLDAWAVWSADLNTDLIRYYKLNETSGTATDFVGGYNGIVVGATQGASGKIGTGYSFDGNGYVYADPAGLTTGSNDGSICAWFNTTSAGYDNVVNWGNYAAVGDMRGMVITNNNKFGISQYGGVVESNSLINTGNWVFGCIVADQVNVTHANWSVYVNGTLEKSGVLYQAGVLVNFSIGKIAKTTAEFWNGNIDEVGIWNRTLTSAEVTQLWNGGTGITWTDNFGDLVIILNSPSIDASLTDKDVVFNCTGSDETAVQNVSLIINGSYNNTNATVVNATPVINTIPLADGYYNWTCEVCDNEDNCENATARNFNINTAPTINVFSPPVNTSNYTTNSIYINATSTLPIGKWIANYNGTNYTLATINTSVTIPDGNHHLLLYGNNSDSGKWGLNDTIYFNVDNTDPVINITYPIGTINYHENNTNLTLNYTASDTHIDSCWYQYQGVNTSLNCSATTYSGITITNASATSVILWANDTFGNLISDTQSWSYGVFAAANTFNATTYETALESFYTYALGSVTNVYLNYNGTSYSATNNSYNWTTTINIPTAAVGTQSFNWNYTVSGVNITSTAESQTVGAISFYLCENISTNTTYFNISFQDEADLSVINASIPYSTFVYYTGNGTLNKTLTFTNTTDNYYYEFCATPNTSTFNVVPYIQYEQDSDYPQRVWNPTVQTYNSTITNQILYLLNSADGIYVTFQVVSYSQQPLSGVEVEAERTINGSIVTVGQGTTGADGSVTFWLNPNFIHDFTFIKEGYDTYETSFAPTQTSYTITLGGGIETNPSYFRGIDYSILPVNNSLVNDTIYTFGFNLTSSYWDLQEYGFNLRLRNGTIITGDTTTTSGTPLTLNYNVSNQTKIYMDYYWLINDTYTNVTRSWNVYNTDNTQFSIFTFFTDLNSYIDSGLFGLDDFGRTLIIFIIIFLSVGILTYKYGLTSPIAVLTSIFLIVFFFDVVVGLIPAISIASGYEVPYILTFVTGVILAMVILKEVST